MDGPQVGETRTANGQTRSWTGTEWKPVSNPQPVSSSETSDPTTASIQALKDYASELMSGKGTARTAAENFGGQELKGFGETLNPINQVRGIVKTLTTDPRETIGGMVDTGKNALSGDPRSIGNILGMVVAPKADAAALKGVNSAATAVADNPSVRHTVGYVAGGGGAMLAGGGMGGRFMGAAAGRMLSPLMEGPARDVANGTGWLMDKLGIRDAPPDVAAQEIAKMKAGAKVPPSVQPMSDAAYEAAAGHPRGAFPQPAPVEANPEAAFAEMMAPKGGVTDTQAAQQVASRNVSGDWNSNLKPNFTAQDVVRLKLLMANGASEADAVKSVLGSRP